MNRQKGFTLLLIGFLVLPGWFAAGQELKEPDKKGRDGAERREILEKHRDELKGLSPDERQAKIREILKKEGSSKGKGMSPEERQAKRKEMRERMEKQLGELRKKKADGTLSPAEKKRLEHMEEVARRMEKNQAAIEAGSTNKVGKGSGEK